MAEGKSTISITGDASGLESAALQSKLALGQIESSAKKANDAMAAGPLGGGGGAARLLGAASATAGGGVGLGAAVNNPGADIADWSKKMDIGKPLEQVKQFRQETDKAAEGGKNIGQAFRGTVGQLTGAVAAAVALVTLVTKLYDLYKGLKNAAGEWGRELKSITDAQKIAITEGLTWQEQAINKANEIAASQKEQLEISIEQRNIFQEQQAIKSGFAADILKEQQIESARLGVISQIAAKEERIADLKADADAKQAEANRKQATSDLFKRGDDIRRQLAVEGMTDIQRLEFEFLELKAAREAEIHATRVDWAKQEIASQLELEETLYQRRRDNKQKEIDEDNKRKEEQIKKDADTRMKAEMEADRRIHDERKRQLDELRDSASGDLGGIQYFNSGRDAIWMSGGGGR